MRSIVFILLVVFSQTLRAQLNPNQINFGQLKYDLLEEQLTQQDLEEILNTFSAFGDKEVILEAVVSSFLIKPNTEYADSLIDFWLNDYTKMDSIQLMKIPVGDKDYRERAFYFVWMSFFVQAYVEDISFIEAYIKTSKDKAKYFPNLPDLGEYSGLMAVVNNYYIFNKWVLKHPEEYLYFEDKLKRLTNEHWADYNEKNLVEFIDVIIADVKEKRLIYEQYLPFPLQNILDMRALQNVEIEDDLGAYCNEKEIDIFVKDAYKKIFNETLSPEGLLAITTYIKENDLYQPEVIYLALILSKYE